VERLQNLNKEYDMSTKIKLDINEELNKLRGLEEDVIAFSETVDIVTLENEFIDSKVLKKMDGG
jgi:hypothetical protein